MLEMLVLQYAILKPILAYLSAVLWADDKFVSEDVRAHRSLASFHCVYFSTAISVFRSISLNRCVIEIDLAKGHDFSIFYLVGLFNSIHVVQPNCNDIHTSSALWIQHGLPG